MAPTHKIGHDRDQKLPQKIGQHLYVYVPYSIDRNKHRPKFITFADIFYVYSFWHIFDALRLFPALCLFWTVECKCMFIRNLNVRLFALNGTKFN